MWDAPIDTQMVEEDTFERAMELVNEKDWTQLKALLDRASSNTAEAIRESLSAEALNNLMKI